MKEKARVEQGEFLFQSKRAAKKGEGFCRLFTHPTPHPLVFLTVIDMECVRVCVHACMCGVGPPFPTRCLLAVHISISFSHSSQIDTLVWILFYFILLNMRVSQWTEN